MLQCFCGVEVAWTKSRDVDKKKTRADVQEKERNKGEQKERKDRAKREDREIVRIQWQ